MSYEVKAAPKRRNGKPDDLRYVFRVEDGQKDVVVARFIATGFARKIAGQLNRGEITEIEAKGLEKSTLAEIARLTAEKIAAHMHERNIEGMA